MHVLVLQFAGVILVEHVAKSEHELEFGAQLEEGQIEITTQTQLQINVGPLELQIVFRIARKVDHGVHAHHHVGTVVVEALGSKDQVAGCRYIDALHALLLTDVGSVVQLVGMVQEGVMAGAEIHGWSHAEGKVLAQARLAQHAYGETGVPVVLVAGDEPGSFRAVFILDGHGAHVVQFHVLQVRTDEHAEVERAQIRVGTVLHGTLLSLQANGRQHEE